MMAANIIRTPILIPMDVDTFKDSGRLSHSDTTTTVQTPPLVSRDTHRYFHCQLYSWRRSSVTPPVVRMHSDPTFRPPLLGRWRSSTSIFDTTTPLTPPCVSPQIRPQLHGRRSSSKTTNEQTPIGASEDIYTLSHAQPSSIMSSTAIIRSPTVANVDNHTMGTSLAEYLLMKIHPDIHNKIWSRIIVKGLHERDLSIVRVPSDIEKTDKPFNWQRPTTSALDSKTLQLNVFPGGDYVQHYAAIIATYLSLQGRDPNVVQYMLPSTPECFSPLIHSNLAKMGKVDIVILGYVHGLDRWTADGEWEENDVNQLFSWKTMPSKQGYRIAFLGCRICYWGDIGGNVVRELQRVNGAKCIFYLGKLGTLRPSIIPNQALATGGQSFVSSRNKTITWRNPLEPYLHHAPSARVGVHYSMPSVLDETKDWLLSAESKYDFVDPEIGQMAKAAEEGGAQYGYLHIISDNLAKKYERDLSNERFADVIQGRKRLMGEIQDVLEAFFSEWAPKTGA